MIMLILWIIGIVLNLILYIILMSCFNFYSGRPIYFPRIVKLLFFIGASIPIFGIVVFTGCTSAILFAVSEYDIEIKDKVKNSKFYKYWFT